MSVRFGRGEERSGELNDKVALVRVGEWASMRVGGEEGSEGRM